MKGAAALLIAPALIGAFLLRPEATDPDARPQAAAAPIDVAALPLHLEDLTWPEVDAFLEAGRRTVIVPTGGTEQNGPHMILGKHNRVVRATAERIARQLGDALVAPVLSYVPEGDPRKKQGHMAFPGTISISEQTFTEILVSAAESLRLHGFTTVAFISDSGDSQRAQARAVEQLQKRWQEGTARALHVSAYYSDNGQAGWLQEQGETDAAIGRHAGIRDTSELLAVHPEGVRTDRARPGHAREMTSSGVDGDPTRATAARGRKMLDLKVAAAVRQIRARRESGAR